MSKKTVLILGGTGFVGSYLREHLRDEHRVLTTSRSGAGADLAFDLARASTTSLFDEVAPDAVVNCTVCYGATLEECFEVNVRQSGTLFMALRNRPLHFVQISSVSATPENRHHNDYGLTKALSDELLEYCALRGALRVSILRFSQIFDTGGRSAGSQPGLHAWVKALATGEPIKVYDRAPKKRSYIPVETVAGAIALTIREAIHGTHDVMTPETYTPLELVHLLAGLADYDTSRIEVVDKEALGYAIPPCSPRFEGWLAKQEPARAAFARLFPGRARSPA
ncbi:hypothetical protein BH11MYX4_BH11MYX4_04750 [soil metagenome]